MKKTIVKITMVSALMISSVSAFEACDKWFAKNDFGIVGTMGKEGVGVVLDNNGEMNRIFASGTARYDFNDGDEISEALKEASLIAKGNLAMYMKEKISSDESIEKISSKRKELVKNGADSNSSVVKKTVKTQTMSIKSHADALMTGLIKVCESNDANIKEIQVVLAVSPKTSAAATKAVNMMNKELGSRKSVEEYEAERRRMEVQTQTPASSSSNNSGTKSSNGSFSNKAKNMNF
jgi:hypothetical protein